ncbi:hypothetical protein J3Q64DRAFT_1862347 [Phycomyces blakesleeanus]|uniref:F-box domain-containing protein n=2 Tax=Phycomyces blakesleeanus TaxID=4837 RepID=A0A162U094_PHYB8|nr:hypothetical protein PHYBLDRAFT_146632 [Phycomyces blakesleeanus NRRL 1555(-)]OAD72442.1 hypothetical protein PHYBLDRAFT_146632 [Phycomyces blakesleeanus NRRL 1555(-)]|eukprot:XP_018290482.1 hypothetical protein PHYBLDRAFT_146632 [Phycomyces blakesleeanus NRRL 1555(-)]
MPASELPYEILSLVADYLYKDYKFECIFVCKGWKTTFQELFWKDREVRSVKKLEDAAVAVKHSTSDFPYGVVLQTLTIVEACTLHSLLQSDAFETFYNLKHLVLEHVIIDSTDIKKITYSRPWKSLISLKLVIKIAKQNSLTPILIRLLTNYPSLKEIDVSPHSSMNSLNFNLKNFNTLHKRSPQLESIKGCFNLTNIHSNSVNTIPTTIAALHVTTLDLDLLDWDYLWLYYFSYKYPNIRTLKWKTMCESRERIVKEYNRNKAELLHSLKNVFPHLTTLEFYTEDRSTWSHALFWDLLCRSNVPIKKLTYILRVCFSSPNFQQMLIQRLLQSFEKTLETFFVAGNVSYDIRYIVRLNIPSCPVLVDLTLYDCGIYIDLDNLLDSCPALRRLMFTSGQLYISPEIREDPGKHGLRILGLDNVDASAPVFSYMSYRCRNLEYMNLDSIRISGSISEETGSLLINMPYTRLKKLDFHRVLFYPSNDHMNEKKVINLILLSQLKSSFPSDENEDHVDEIHDVDHLAWFHLFCKKITIGFESKIRKLPKEEIATATEYYKSTPATERVNLSEERKSFQGLVPKRFWEKDLWKGYVELRCGHIASYKMPLLWVDEDDY